MEWGEDPCDYDHPRGGIKEEITYIQKIVKVGFSVVSLPKN